MTTEASNAWEDREVITSPFGFLRPVMDGRTDVDHQGHPDIDKWFTYMTDSRVSDQVRQEVIEYAHDLFSLCSSVEAFFRWNYNNAKLSDSKKRFINDTLRFIHTGKRHISVSTYWELFQHAEGQDVPTVEKYTKPIPYAIEYTKDEANMLFHWLSHEGGFMDLLWTLRILFGSHEKSLPETETNYGRTLCSIKM